MASGSRLARVLGRLPLATSTGELLSFISSSAPIAAQTLLNHHDEAVDCLRVQAAGRRLLLTAQQQQQQRSFAASAVADDQVEQQPEQQQQQQKHQQGDSTSATDPAEHSATTSSSSEAGEAVSNQSAPSPSQQQQQQSWQQQQPWQQQQQQRTFGHLESSIYLSPNVTSLHKVVSNVPSRKLAPQTLVLALQRLRRLDTNFQIEFKRQIDLLQQQLLQAEEQSSADQQQLVDQQQQHKEAVGKLLQQLDEQLAQVVGQLSPQAVVQVLSLHGQLLECIGHQQQQQQQQYALLEGLLQQLVGRLDQVPSEYLPTLAAALASLDATNLDVHSRQQQQQQYEDDMTAALPSPLAAAAADQSPAAGAAAAAAAAAELSRRLLVELCDLIQQSSFISDLTAAGVARLISSLGRLGHYNWQTMRRLSLVAADQAKDMTAANITSVLMGCAKLRHYDQDLCDVMAAAADQQMTAATGAQVAQICWALARMKHDTPSVFATAAEQAVKRAYELEPRHVSNLSWAFAVRKAYNPELCNTLAARVQQLLLLPVKARAAGVDSSLLQHLEFEPHHLSLIAWGLAKHGHQLEGFMQELGDAAALVVDKMAPQNISNLAWSYGRLNTPHPKLFSELTAVAKDTNLEGFGNQNITDLAWGCAATGFKDDELFDLLSRVTVRMISDFSPHSLADLTWAFAASKPPSAAAVLQAAAPAAAACLARFSCGMLSDLLWSYGSVGVRDEELLNAAAEVLPHRTLNLLPDTESQAKVVWSLKMLNYRNPELEAVLAEIIPNVRELLDS